jgi:asparagine synthase (glutamine-hydrolysing)
VLVHLYERYGVDLVHELEGMYAFAIWDGRRRRLLLVRDRFGEKPLFYTERDGTLVFASELTSLLAGIRDIPTIDTAALDAYFTYGYVSADRSVLAGVKQLRAGHLLVWDADRQRSNIRRYWRPPGHGDGRNRPLSELVSETAELLDRSVKSRLISDVPLGVFLSGGVDSTLVAVLAARHTAGRLKTFTVDYDVGSVGERAGARAAATAIGSDHHELVLTTNTVRDLVPGLLGQLDQPLADPAFVPLWALSDFARSHVTVAVGGEGADELFGGYPRYRWLARGAALPRWMPRRLAAATAGSIGRASGRRQLSRLGDVLAPSPLLERHVDWVTAKRRRLRARLYGPRLREVLRDAPVEAPAGVEFSEDDVVGSLMRLDQLQWLPDDVLAKADRATMRASLEFRTPFLARELVEFAATVPPEVHVKEGGKLLLRRVLRRIAPDVRCGRKVAFRTPMAEWLRGPLASALTGQLSESRLYSDGWLERETVASWIRTHSAGHSDMSQALWPIFVLGCWYAENLPV